MSAELGLIVLLLCLSRILWGGGGEGGDREERNRENSAILHSNIYFRNLTTEHKTQQLLRKGWNLRGVDVTVSRKTVQYPSHPIDT